MQKHSGSADSLLAVPYTELRETVERDDIITVLLQKRYYNETRMTAWKCMDYELEVVRSWDRLKKTCRCGKRLPELTMKRGCRWL